MLVKGKGCCIIYDDYGFGTNQRKANAQLIAAAPEILAQLISVRKLIAEAAMTGFNCHKGDWADRLFTSQQTTSSAIAIALALGSKP